MTKITRLFGCIHDETKSYFMSPEVPYYSGHTKFIGHTYDYTTLAHPTVEVSCIEIFITMGKIWEVPKGGKIELEWTDDLTALNPNATMNLIGEAYE